MKITNKLGGTYSRTQEEYYILAGGNIKDGSYKIVQGNKTVVSGFYDHGQKDSLWQFYSYNGTIAAKKWYTRGEKTGKWEFFTTAGEPDWSYDFVTGTGLNLKDAETGDIKYDYQNDPGKWVHGKLDKAPIPLYGKAEWNGFAGRNLQYPEEAVNNRQQGIVTLGIVVDQNGKAIDYTVIKSAGKALDNETLRVYQLFSPEYIPGEKNGKKVIVKVPVDQKFVAE
jgi:TonB family protein